MHGLLPPTRWLQCHGAAHTPSVTLQGGEIRKRVKAPLGRSTPAAGGDERHLRPQGGPANMADMATMRLGLGLAAPCGSGGQPASGWGAQGSPLIWAVPRQMGGTPLFWVKGVLGGSVPLGWSLVAAIAHQVASCPGAVRALVSTVLSEMQNGLILPTSMTEITHDLNMPRRKILKYGFTGIFSLHVTILLIFRNGKWACLLACFFPFNSK